MTNIPVIDGEIVDNSPFQAVPDAFRSAPAGGQLTVPNPQGGLSGQPTVPRLDSFNAPNSYAYRRDPNIPNYVQVDERDWTPEVDELNRRIAADIDADPGLLNHLSGRGRFSAGSLGRELLEDGGIQLLGAATDYLGIPTDPRDFADLASSIPGAVGQAVADFLGVPDYTPQAGFTDAPFTGGQSPGVLYEITWRVEGTVTNSGNNQESPRALAGTTRLRGPISRSILKSEISTTNPNEGVAPRINGLIQASASFTKGTARWVEFDIVRVDGQPDTGGDPQGEPTLVGDPDSGNQDRDFTDPSAPGLPGIGLPRPSIPNLPGIENPFGEVEETGEPSGGFPGIDPVLPNVPGLDPFDDVDGSGEGSPSPTTPERLECCEKIDQIHGYFQKSGAGQYDAAQCDAEPFFDAWEGTGLTGLYRAVEALTRAVGLIWERLRCLEGGAVAIPEWWAVRPGADVPQLAVAFEAEGSRSRWSITIPHYNRGEDFRPQLPKFEKGSYFSTLTLTDNTKLVINAKTFDEGERVINALVPLIDPAYLPPALDIKQGRRKGRALTEAVVIPKTAAFYPRGQQSPVPDFYADFQVI